MTIALELRKRVVIERGNIWSLVSSSLSQYGLLNFVASLITVAWISVPDYCIYIYIFFVLRAVVNFAVVKFN